VSLGRQMPQVRDQGSCSSCRETFEYSLIHNGFSDSAYAYCDRCGMTAFFDGRSSAIPGGVTLKVHGPIGRDVEPHAAPCDCGGHFRGDGSPRCTKCLVQLDPELCATFIEKNAPGTAMGWRWQRSWQGLYAIVIDGRSIKDPWRSGDAA
jgi:hypothetical protein